MRHNQISHYQLSHRGIRIAHLSDVHVSPVMRAVDVKVCFEKMLSQNPDILLLTGDLLMPFSEQPQEHRYLIEQLKAVGIPKYACLGNHDLPVRDEFVQELEDIGVRVLIDSQELIETKDVRILLSGLDFRWTSAQRHVQEVCTHWNKDAEVKILLVHDPRYFKYLPEKFDLVLSGHTHGGQVAAK